MPRRIIAALSVVTIIVLFGFLALFNPSTSASPQELTVISRTKGNEVLTAVVLDNDVKIRLKNNHNDTITAFAISLSGTTIKVDFAFSEVHFGIEPGDTYEKSYAVSPSPTGELPTIHLLTVMLKNGDKDGNLKVAQEIEEHRLGEKIQTLRALRVLEKEGQLRKDLKTIKDDIVAALNAGDYETRLVLNELQRSDTKLSDNLRAGLQWGRETILHRLQEVEQMPTASRERGLMRLKERSQRLFEKL